MASNKERIEAKLLTFQLVLDVKGNIWTDIGGLPESEIKKCFKNREDAHVIEILVREGKIKLNNIHSYLENEVTAIQFVE
tara:strand:+ start:294 stop:533 length:240 start_codon:yes stop_codon:yes gene_type:complete